MGIVLLVIGTVPFALVGPDTSYWLLGAALYVRGLGLGSTMMPTMSAAVTTLSRTAVSRASSSLNIIVQLGGSVGTALLAVILSREISSGIPRRGGGGGGTDQMGGLPDQVREQIAPKLADAFGTTFWVALGLTAVLVLPVLLLPRNAPAGGAGEAPPPAL
ncbi:MULTISPECIES: hypothetical protein [Thermomonosporaceae]|uniref:hypothetical protein n=1 Tax=Thermomonosporaceae TaxID=2012 RepID=UPI00255B30FF|nr:MULTISPECIES: hypothetical protein [Thermomonosporaceae]MDL4771298.1 hypothetical protein [Actinomadura xylanilytica]